MDITSFFDALEEHYAKNLPFVVYRKPNSSVLRSWIQKDAELHKTDSFLESGFVFAPFNLKDKSILFPESECVISEVNTDVLEVEFSTPSDIIYDKNDKTQHINLVSKGVDAIKKGGLQKVVLSRCVTKSLQNSNPLTIFKRLFNSYKTAMVYCWYHPKVGLWIGATPELLFQVEGKRLTTMSLAGTKSFHEDLELEWTPKEYEEQQIVTDFIVNQLQPYSKSINVSEVETIQAGKLLHLRTKISSIISDNSELKPIIEALHPTPAVCGFPKDEAKNYILQHEHYDRDFYTGFLGELNLKTSKSRNSNRRNVENNAYSVVKTESNFFVNLRSMQLQDESALIYVGGGITNDSNPEHEWEETVNKTSTINAVLS